MNSNRNKLPVAPPVYRLQVTTRALQPKGIVNPRFTPPRPHTAPNVIQKPTGLIQPKPIPQRPFAATGRPVIQPAIGIGTSSVIQQGRKPKGGKKAPQKRAVVTLTVGAKDYSGVSSGQFGHAEMQALRKFIMAYDTIAKASKALDEATKLKVRCPNQDVCGSCTTVLQALGFEPRAGTSFSKSKSGGVSWGANMKVREFLAFRGLDATYQKALKAGAK